jgi:undecaprenyl phosphate N,N'-diacetylbacillosamine 1-phosphate transferase
MYKNVLKRLIDIVVALLVLSIASPIMGLVGLLLSFDLKGNPFFTQARPGKGGRIFTLLKFRSMSNKRDARGELLPDDARLSGMGLWVRKLSLDELPQLWNVLKGDMSLIGPRPLLVEYLPLYNERQARRHEVRPGITGWAQVNGRNALGWPERFEHDVWYIEHLTFALDIRILWMTIMKVLKREGVSGEGTVTMEKFKGDLRE